MTASSDPFLPSAVAYSERMESRCFLVSFSAERFVSRVSRRLAMSAEGFRLRRGGCNLGSQTLLLSADARQPFLGLRELIAEVGGSADRLKNRRAMRFLLLFEHREVGGCARRFLLAECELLLRRREIGGCRVEQLLVTIAFFLKRRQASLSLRQLRLRRGRAHDEFRAALFVGADARLAAIAFDCDR